jgi:hypothetical protein
VRCSTIRTGGRILTTTSACTNPMPRPTPKRAVSQNFLIRVPLFSLVASRRPLGSFGPALGRPEIVPRESSRAATTGISHVTPEKVSQPQGFSASRAGNKDRLRRRLAVGSWMIARTATTNGHHSIHHSHPIEHHQRQRHRHLSAAGMVSVLNKQLHATTAPETLRFRARLCHRDVAGRGISAVPISRRLRSGAGRGIGSRGLRLPGRPASQGGPGRLPDRGTRRPGPSAAENNSAANRLNIVTRYKM